MAAPYPYPDTLYIYKNRNIPKRKASIKDLVVHLINDIFPGVAGQDDAVLYPEHIYYNDISDDAGKGWQRVSKTRSRLMSENSDTHKNVYGGIQKTREKSFAHRSFRQSKILVATQQSKSMLSQPSKTLLQARKSGNLMRKSKLSIIVSQNKSTSKTDIVEKEKDRLMKQEEQKIFAKTKKTPSDLQFENSDWYKNYVNFKAVFEDIKDKMEKEGKRALNEEERKWYESYMKFKERYCEIMKHRKDRNKDLTQEQMFEMLNSEELKNKCPPVMVVYPSGDCASVCECDSIKGD